MHYKSTWIKIILQRDNWLSLSSYDIILTGQLKNELWRDVILWRWLVIVHLLTNWPAAEVVRFHVVFFDWFPPEVPFAVSPFVGQLVYLSPPLVAIHLLRVLDTSINISSHARDPAHSNKAEQTDVWGPIWHFFWQPLFNLNRHRIIRVLIFIRFHIDFRHQQKKWFRQK